MPSKLDCLRPGDGLSQPVTNGFGAAPFGAENTAGARVKLSPASGPSTHFRCCFMMF
jgi:hypothetical protein